MPMDMEYVLLMDAFAIEKMLVTTHLQMNNEYRVNCTMMGQGGPNKMVRRAHRRSGLQRCTRMNSIQT